MSDHPLYLQRVTLADWRTGRVVIVHDEGAAFEVDFGNHTETVMADDLSPYRSDICRTLTVNEQTELRAEQHRVHSEIRALIAERKINSAV